MLTQLGTKFGYQLSRGSNRKQYLLGCGVLFKSFPPSTQFPFSSALAYPKSSWVFLVSHVSCAGSSHRDEAPIPLSLPPTVPTTTMSSAQSS